MVSLFTLLSMKLKAFLLLSWRACIELCVSLSDWLRWTCVRLVHAARMCVFLSVLFDLAVLTISLLIFTFRIIRLTSNVNVSKWVILN